MAEWGSKDEEYALPHSARTRYRECSKVNDANASVASNAYVYTAENVELFVELILGISLLLAT